MKLTPSVNKTERGSWNNFNSDTLDNFVKQFHPDFVDVPADGRHYNCWTNSEDTAVMKLPALVSWTVVSALRDLNADEFDFCPVSNNEVIIRLWWD